MLKKSEIKPDNFNCLKCEDTGWFAYDHNHSTVCDECCPHNQGWWILTEAHGKDRAGMECCNAGCGYIKQLPDREGYSKYEGPFYD